MYRAMSGNAHVVLPHGNENCSEQIRSPYQYADIQGMSAQKQSGLPPVGVA
jgi:hypothetical protein